jgi:hypothetical protein
MNNYQFMKWAMEVAEEEYAGNVAELMRCL